MTAFSRARLSLLLIAAPWLAAQKVEIAREVKHGASASVRFLRSDSPMAREAGGNTGNVPLPVPLASPSDGEHPRDLALQHFAPRLQAPSTILNFAGLGNGAYNSVDNFIPPDTNGSPGLTQYVQWVNGEFAVFAKNTGALIQGPTYGNLLWQSFGASDPCYANNAGDVIAQYDKLANRWVLSQFTGTKGPPYYQCFAISQTSDATGAYWLYEFAFNDYFNDYPQIAVWPDGYYGTFNTYDSNNNFQGGRTCAYQRSAMLAGTVATSQCYTLVQYGGLLPSDLDGSTPPPSGAPNYVIGLEGSLSAIDLFSFHIDWVTPSNSTFLGPQRLSVIPFTPACYGEFDNLGTCISQPNTSQQLDSMGDRLMYRLAYRNFGDHEAMVVNHSVDTGRGNVGVRWYEIRNPSSTPVIYQQSTYAPDTDSRWIGSIVMDHAGNIALGYGVSSSVTYPSVRFTGRQVSDAINTMESENTMAAGSGSQVPQNGAVANRWGGYSNFSVDPVDDCTLWYTHEYMTITADFAWSTRIGNLKFSGCQVNAVNPSFSVFAPPIYSVYQDASAIFNVSTSGINGFSASVALTATGLPAGTTANFSPATIIPPGSGTSVLTIPVPAGTSPGTYSVVITATGGGATQSTTIQLTVIASGGYNTIEDGGFEMATVAGVNAPGWIGTVSTPGQNLVVVKGTAPHGGNNYASFTGSGGAPEEDSLGQYIAIPAGLSFAELTFWINVTTQPNGRPTEDTLTVNIQDSSGINHPQVVLSNLDSLSDHNVLGQYFQPSAINLLPWAGQTIQIVFSSSTTSTTFLLDDVNLSIVESGGSCAFTINPTTYSFDANANGGSAGVTTNLPYCAWTPAPDSSWISYNSPVGSGNSSFTFGLLANTTGVARTGHIAVGSATLAVTQAATAQVFSDVPPTSYYFDAVDLFSSKGITSGCGPTTYCPGEAVTRAQMAVFIVRMMLGTDNFTYNSVPYFTDVPTGSFGFQWIQKFFELGITSGCGRQIFCPSETVTRNQMAVFIIKGRYGASTDFDYTLTPYFNDVPTGAFGFSYVQRMREDNITAGCGPNMYCPTSPVLRGDMAIFIMHGGFNAQLPAGVPYLFSISPTTIANGASGMLTVNGANTNFVQDVTVLNAIPGMWFGKATVLSPTSLLVPIAASAASTPLPISIWVTTGLEEVVLPNSIQIQ